MSSYGLTQDSHGYVNSIGRAVRDYRFPQGNVSFGDSGQMYQYLLRQGDLINPKLCAYMSLGAEDGSVFLANVVSDLTNERPYEVEASRIVFWQCVNRAIENRSYLAPYLYQVSGIESRLVAPAEFDFYSQTAMGNRKDPYWFTVPEFLRLYTSFQLHAETLLPRYIEPLRYDRIVFATKKNELQVFSAVCSLQKDHLFDGGAFIGLTKPKPLANGYTEYAIHFDRDAQGLLYPWKEYHTEAVRTLSKALPEDIVFGESVRDYTIDAFLNGLPAGCRISGMLESLRPHIDDSSVCGAQITLTEPLSGLSVKLPGVRLDRAGNVQDVPAETITAQLQTLKGQGVSFSISEPKMYYPPYIKTCGPER